MKLLLICVALTAGVVAAQDTYTTSFKAQDVENLLKNDRLLKSYINCMLEKGPCTPEGKQLKEKLPEALESHCAKCSPDQQLLGKKVVKQLMSAHPDMWKQLMDKYDPERKYEKSFQDFLNE